MIVSTYVAVYSIKPFHVFQHSTAFLYPLKMSGDVEMFSGGVEILQKTGKQRYNLKFWHEIGSKVAATANPQPSRQLPV